MDGPTRSRRADTAIADFARWIEEHRGVEVGRAGLRRAARVVGGRPGRVLVGGRRVPGSDLPRPADGDPGLPGDAGRAVVPGRDAQLRRARADPRAPAGPTTTSRWSSPARTGLGRDVTHAELREQVRRARAGLVAAGVGRGDRVVALAPNCPETLVMFLAAASLGAIWSSCSPDFGARAVHDRFAQIEPSVLLAVDGYCYGGKRFDIRGNVTALRQQLPTVRTTVLLRLPRRGRDAGRDDRRGRSSPRPRRPLEFEPVPFDHPLWVLYSSGTTGLPKGIVHGHGGIVLEHLKALRLQKDLGPGERFFWFTTTGWMMWNLLIGGLLVGLDRGAVRRQPGPPGPGRAVGAGRPARRDLLRDVGAVHPVLPARPGCGRGSATTCPGYGRWARPGRRCRWTGSAGWPTRSASTSRSARCPAAPTCARRSCPRRRPCRCGWASCPARALGADVHAYDEQGDDLSTRSASW